MKDIIIYGTGGLGRETVLLVNDINKCIKKYNLLGFSVDDEYYQEGKMIDGYKLYTKEWLISHREEVFCVCAIGYPMARRKTMLSLLDLGIEFESLIHPTSSIVDIDNMGKGCIIGGYCFTSTGVVLGDGIFLDGFVNIGHDAVLENYVTCFPKAQISGGSYIGEASSIGSLAFIHEKRKIGKEVVIAPGSIVLRNVKDKMHVFGNPARIVEI